MISSHELLHLLCILHFCIFIFKLVYFRRIDFFAIGFSYLFYLFFHLYNFAIALLVSYIGIYYYLLVSITLPLAAWSLHE